MTEQQDPKAAAAAASSSTTSSKVAGDISSNGGTSANGAGQKIHYPNPPDTNGAGQKIRYPNPPEATNPDPATLREQWKFAIRQYSKWSSHAWGTAILAGLSFFALGWYIKGSNPLASKQDEHPPPPPPSSADDR